MTLLDPKRHNNPFPPFESPWETILTNRWIWCKNSWRRRPFPSRPELWLRPQHLTNYLKKYEWISQSTSMLCKYLCIENDRRVPNDKQLCHIAFSQKKKDICKYVKIEIIGFHEDSSWFLAELSTRFFFLKNIVVVCHETVFVIRLFSIRTTMYIDTNFLQSSLHGIWFLSQGYNFAPAMHLQRTHL